MAVFNSNDVTVSIGGVLLTDHITSVDFGGLKDGNVSLEFLQDFAATEVYATLNPLLGTLTTVIVTPTDAAAAADNPEKSVSCLVTEVPFIASGVADLATISVSWPMSGPVTTTTA